MIFKSGDETYLASTAESIYMCVRYTHSRSKMAYVTTSDVADWRLYTKNRAYRRDRDGMACLRCYLSRP